MKSMGFTEKWIKWIMLCVTTVNYTINFNGKTVGPIIPSRGLRQGDPLSPYLFLFCVEGLSHSLTKAAVEGCITGCQIATDAPRVTHLLFADDSFLFFKATETECSSIKSLLNRYESNSGQAVNYFKSGIFFSANVRLDKQQAMRSILEVHNDLKDSKYLGLPSFVGKSKKSVFKFVKERIWRKVQDWNHRTLSKAGKTVMVKNVGQTIPSYSMSCFLLPKTMCSEMERLLNGYWWNSSGNSSKGIRWFGWGKMARPKTEGGLGFRDFYGFNLALLGKHIWKFCNNTSSLVSRLFRARYFPRDNVLNAPKGSGSSFVWTGIWEAKEQLKKGFRWIVGDGEDIRIFKDPWLRGKRDFCVENNQMNGERNEKKCCYFHPNSKVWDVQKVQQVFHPHDIPLILQTRIPQVTTKDRIAWTTSSTCMYTVKTGYQYWSVQSARAGNHANNANAVNATNAESKGWNKLWSLNLPYKMRTFLWRFCNNNIPVRNLLRSKGVDINITCPMCGTDIEHVLHLFFFQCRFASDCWTRENLFYDMQQVESASQWLLDKLISEEPEKLERIAIVLSSIWFARNQKIWENKCISSSIAVDICNNQVKEWQEAMIRRANGINLEKRIEVQRSLTWQPPPTDCLKLNVDASVFRGESSFSLGMVIRNDQGHFLKGKNMKMLGEIAVMEAEAKGVQEAIKWVEDQGLRNVIIECDSELVVKAIHNDIEYYLEVGHVLEFCKMKIRLRPDISLCHVKRQVNRVAHLLARVECQVDCYNVFESPPNVLLETLYSEFP